MESRIAIFSKLVRDCMRGMPLAVGAEMPLGEVALKMESAGASSATVIDAEGCPVGIITERDITRRAAFKLDATTPVEAAMTTPVSIINEDEYLYYAIARMRRRGLRHMPVVDRTRRLAGMLNLHDALAVASETLMGQIDHLTRDESLEGLKLIKAAQVELADQLLSEHMPATQIQALLTHINNDIYRRVVNLNLSAMTEEGRGGAPVAFTVIVMGSGGRGENFLYPDQDNGFILEDYPDDRHTEIDAWFIELAERMTRDLDTVGLPSCKGFVMATNPLWRKNLRQWKEQVRLWSSKRGVTALRLCDIFFDFRQVWGDGQMADELRQFVTETAGGNKAFLRDMFEDDIDHMVALGWFGRLLTEKDDEDFKGRINLKHTGTLPLVEAMRLLAFREGTTAISTLDRLDALMDCGVLDADEHDYLAGAFRHISHILLRQQIADFKAGTKVSNFVHPDTLSERERDMLVDSFKAIRSLREKIKSDFTGDIF
ncbi:MAG: CBS domain-containing protein [Alphaproteobacteria bacterium]|nr:CBS domain-containing protein [Alphaproteobacteria bacterium]